MTCQLLFKVQFIKKKWPVYAGWWESGNPQKMHSPHPKWFLNTVHWNRMKSCLSRESWTNPLGKALKSCGKEEDLGVFAPLLNKLSKATTLSNPGALWLFSRTDAREEVAIVQMSAPHDWCRESTGQTFPYLWVTMTKTPISSVGFMIRPPITVWTSLKTQACPKQPITQCQNSAEGSCMEFLQVNLHTWSTLPWVTYETDFRKANTLSLHTCA